MSVSQIPLVGDDGAVQWFGESWGAPVNKTARHALTPVGQPCMRCGIPIRRDDRGLLVVHCTETSLTGRVDAVRRPWHHHCFVTHMTPMVIHRLHFGLPDCGFTNDIPKHWPGWNTWTNRDEEVTCPRCIEARQPKP